MIIYHEKIKRAHLLKCTPGGLNPRRLLRQCREWPYDASNTTAKMWPITLQDVQSLYQNAHFSREYLVIIYHEKIKRAHLLKCSPWVEPQGLALPVQGMAL